MEIVSWLSVKKHSRELSEVRTSRDIDFSKHFVQALGVQRAKSATQQLQQFLYSWATYRVLAVVLCRFA